MTRRLWIFISATVLIISASAAYNLEARRHGNPPTEQLTADGQANPKVSHSVPTLYCDFYNFMHNATVVSFYFFIDLTDHSRPKVSERFFIDPDGTKTEWGGDDGTVSPQWAYGLDDDTPTITSPDGATMIILYGLKPRDGGTLWVEAGLRSNDYRNLEGKCRQANFNEAAK